MRLRSRFTAGFVALALGVAPSPGRSAGRPQLDPIPQPDLSQADPEVREQLEVARQALEEILAGNPDAGALATGYGRTGQLYMLYQLAEIAVPCLANAARLAPTEFSWRYYLALSEQQAGRVDDSIASYLVALDLRPDDLPTLLRLGRIELSRNRMGEAEARFSRALEIQPESTAARHGLGQIALLRGEFRVAADHLEAVLADQPAASTAHYQLGIAYRQLGEIEKAREHLAEQGRQEVEFEDPLLDRLAPLARGAGIRIVQATRARAAGDLETAVASFRAALELAPDDSSARLSLASTLIEMGRREEALSELEEAERRDPRNARVLYNLGTALAAAGRIGPAIERLRAATRADSGLQDAWFNLAELEAGRGEFAAAAEHFERARELTEADPRGRGAIEERLAQVLLRAGRPEAAVLHLEAAAALVPDSLAVLVTLGRVQGQLGRHSEAAASFAQASALDATDLEPRFGRALALLLAASYPEAQRHLEESLAALVGNVTLKHLLARLLATCPDPEVRDGERALVLAQEVMRAELRISHAETVAMSLAELGRFPEAAGLQGQIIEQARRQGRADLVARLEANLRLYREDRPVRAPWLGGG